MEREEVREKMVQTFHIYASINPLRSQVREQTWNDYCSMREAYLKDCMGFRYLPLNQTLRQTGAYD